MRYRYFDQKNFFSLALGFLLWFSIVDHTFANEQGPTNLFKWRSPGHQYVDSESIFSLSPFFSLHGYIDGIFAGTSRDWTAPDPTQLGPPGQLLVPNTSHSGFQYDAAFFIGAEMSQRTRLISEIHLVSDPSGTGAAGPGGATFAVTEANVAFDIKPGILTLTTGLFWAPFGTVNKDWLGAQNLFSLIPRASGAFPSHLNDRGIRVNGAKSFSERAGMNYVLSIGNGVQAFDLSGQTSTDQNNNKTIIGRIGLFPGLGKRLDIGYSFASGKLRDKADLTKVLTDPSRYPADFVAHGLDTFFTHKGFMLRMYYIASKETLDSDLSTNLNPSDLSRKGAMAEGSLNVPLKDFPLDLKAFVPKLRFDWVTIPTLTGNGSSTVDFKTAVSSIGFDIYPENHYYISFEYHIQDELTRPELSNNRFVARFTAEF